MAKQNSVYVEMLIDILAKKNDLLDEILELIYKQEKILNFDSEIEKFKVDEFRDTLEEKERLIKELSHADSGFERIYDKVAEVFFIHKELYQDEITRMQGYINVITEKSISIKTCEVRNKTRLDEILEDKKGEVKEYYYNKRNIDNYTESMLEKELKGKSYFIDKKK